MAIDTLSIIKKLVISNTADTFPFVNEELQQHLAVKNGGQLNNLPRVEGIERQTQHDTLYILQERESLQLLIMQSLRGMQE